MKILYAIQGTGNGHLSRAREIIPYLLPHGEIDLLVSGTQAEVQLPYLVKYKKHGLGYTFGQKGGIDFIDSIKQLRPLTFAKDIFTFPVHDYQLIINDFEPITAWACKIKHKSCVSLSHQAAFFSTKTPRPLRKNYWSERILKYYAPTNQRIGFHFKSYDEFIHTPIIRDDVRRIEPSNQGHITVYLPAYADDLLIQAFHHLSDTRWHIFSKHSKQSYTSKNVWVEPIASNNYLKSLAASDGLLTGGGFESPAEALFLRKKLMVIPMMNQYEQQCNAEALKHMGVTVVKEIDDTFIGRLRSWLTFAHPIHVNYPNQTEQIVNQLVETAGQVHINPQLSF